MFKAKLTNNPYNAKQVIPRKIKSNAKFVEDSPIIFNLLIDL